MKRTALFLGLAAVLAWFGAAAARAASVYYPGGGNPPATQITRNLSLKDAAQRGLVKLSAKGPGIEGDNVAMELTNKRIRGPITVTVHAEFTTKPGFPPDSQANLRDGLPEYQSRTETELNRGHYKTKSGDPIQFKVDYQFRAPSDAPRDNYHQILVINPNVDLDEPDPNYRARIKGLGQPNVLGATNQGTFSSLTFSKTKTLAHETLHLVGLDDRYGDFYKVGGQKYPLPAPAMTRSQLTEFARHHRPPLPPPPRGKVVSDNVPGTGPCDIMADSYKDCSRISKRDLKFFEDQAGIQVTAEPGDLLLNKDTTSQNYGVGFRTSVFAAPGQKTVAEGVSVFCIDHSLTVPETQTFDIIGPASQVPSFEPLGKLLGLNSQMQLLLTVPTTGMLGAIWNVTDGTPLNNTPDPEASRAILSQAGIAEDSYPSGLPDLPDPNAGSANTAAVNQGEVINTVPSKPTKRRATAKIQFADLFPGSLRLGGKLRVDLVLSIVGDADRVGIKMQRRSGHRWRRVRALGRRKIDAGRHVLSLKLGKLGGGSYRLVLSAIKLHRVQATRRVPFRVGS